LRVSSACVPNAPDDEEPLDDALVAARPDDAPGRLLAQSRIAAQLFGAAAPGFGRFRVLERLGGGGMGVVYAAYDPQLDRGVALKTVHVPSQSRELALREAKALAKLSHPNVVSVFDVGIEQGDVYIVMELVRGTTLREWVKDKPVRAVIDAYRQAAQGLAAAHDNGLVHRDFKPDNAIVGDDGRVRVVDFGLAVESEATGGGAGTPQYMAPEQRAGSAVTAAADQYSFAVALAEAVPAPLPAWVAAIVERARAEDAAARFASLHDVVRALGRDPVVVRRRRVIAGVLAAGVVGVAGAAFVLGRSASTHDVEPCAGGSQQLASAWSADAQHVQLARVAALSPYGGELARQLEPRLAGFRDSWIANVRDACLAHRRGEQSDALLDRRMACLDRGRAAFAMVGELTTSATADTLPGLAQATSALPVPDACADVASLVDDVEPPAPVIAPEVAALRRELERARVQIAAGRFADARAMGDTVSASARALRYEPLVAEAMLVAGSASLQMEDRAAAVARLTTATTIGLASGRADVGIEAWARRAFVDGTWDHPNTALAGLDVIDALATRSRSAFARALLANNVGAVHLARSERAAAKDSFVRALTWARDVHGPGAVELVAVRTNMALVADDPAETDRLFLDARAELARLLGPDHPDTLNVEWTRAMKSIASTHEAATYLASVCARHELHPSIATRAAGCYAELAELREAEGDRDGARAAIGRAVALGQATLDDTPEVAGYAALYRGDPTAALRAFDAVLATIPRQLGEPFFVGYTRAKLQLGRARALVVANRPREAIAALDAAISGFAEIAPAQQAATIDRKLAAARALKAALTSRAPASTRD
jgi:predicted Ser/Thr protein kinase/tetratricopeptide (TPR) repeat protein